MLEFFKQKKGLIIIGVIIVLVIGKNIYDSKDDYNNIQNEQNILITENISNSNNEQYNDSMIAIHIIGCVKTPGVVKVREGSRIEDLIEVADGLLEDADITNVNLAFVVEDGMKIRIPSIYDEDDVEEKYITQDSGDGVILSNENMEMSSEIININTATQIELESLNGIGPSLAGKIIEYREKNGNFKSIDDIKKVNGIGDNKFESIKDYIKV